MIKFYNKKKDMFKLLELIKDHRVKNFFFTEDRKRHIIEDMKSLKKFLFNCKYVIISEKTDITLNGVIALWEGKGKGIKRNYIKFNVLDKNILSKLLTYLFWYYNKEVFVKIKRTSKFFDVFLEKGFREVYDGKEVLLNRRIYECINK